jgi:hypothetical protein
MTVTEWGVLFKGFLCAQCMNHEIFFQNNTILPPLPPGERGCYKKRLNCGGTPTPTLPRKRERGLFFPLSLKGRDS